MPHIQWKQLQTHRINSSIFSACSGIACILISLLMDILSATLLRFLTKRSMNIRRIIDETTVTLRNIDLIIATVIEPFNEITNRSENDQTLLHTRRYYTRIRYVTDCHSGSMLCILFALMTNTNLFH